MKNEIRYDVFEWDEIQHRYVKVENVNMKARDYILIVILILDIIALALLPIIG